MYIEEYEYLTVNEQGLEAVKQWVLDKGYLAAPELENDRLDEWVKNVIFDAQVNYETFPTLRMPDRHTKSGQDETFTIPPEGLDTKIQPAGELEFD